MHIRAWPEGFARWELAMRAIADRNDKTQYIETLVASIGELKICDASLLVLASDKLPGTRLDSGSRAEFSRQIAQRAFDKHRISPLFHLQPDHCMPALRSI